MRAGPKVLWSWLVLSVCLAAEVPRLLLLSATDGEPASEQNQLG